MSDYTLSIQNLAIGYRKVILAQEINFQLKAGALCAIIGRNGIGKSTLLRTITQLQPKIAGAIVLKNKTVEDYTPPELSSTLSIVLTEPLATKNLTVLELLALGRQPYTNWFGRLTPKDRLQIAAVMEQFDLTALKDRKCYALSDGQLQKVWIARAAVQDTPIMVLDEPTTHLDLHHKVEILKHLRHLATAYQKTILFTTHDIELALQLCDTLLILDGATNPFGAPKRLIDQGCFATLFPPDQIIFDARKGAFTIR
ncbi:MAG: ABC transporter ATP-binding protein [Bacteroidota bacterium]